MKADVIEPLHELLRKNTKWSWTNVHQKSFDAVKQLLTSNKLLICFDSTKEIILTVDASPIGVGAVLAHRMPDGKELPVAFHSKALTSAEKNYSQLDREALAIITGVKKFHHFLYGHKFTIITDHKPLLGIFSSNKPIPDIISPRMLRWSIILSAYNYELIHRPGKLISHADALSRSPINDTDLQTNKAVNLLESWGDTPLSVVEIAEQSASDPIIQTVIGWVINGWPNKTPTDDYLPYFRKRNELSIMENCLLWGSRIVLPSIMHSKILNLTRIAQVVHIRYFILKMSKILHRVRFIVGIFFPWSLILLRLFYADFVRFILSTLYGVFYRHCTVYFTDIVRFNLLTLYGLFYGHCTVYLTYIVRCI